MMKISKLIVLFGAMLLLNLSAQAAQNISFAVQIPNDHWWKAIENGDSKVPEQLKMNLPLEILSQLAEVRKRLKIHSKMNFTVGLTASDEINAFAQKGPGYDLIIITSGFLLHFGNDPDVLAITLSHELAHHYLGHTTHSHTSQSYAENLFKDTRQPIYGLVSNNNDENANNKLPFIPDSFEEIRNQERSADLLGLKWALNTGYSADGLYRLAEGLIDIQGTHSYNPSHPSNMDRMKMAIFFSQQNDLPMQGTTDYLLDNFNSVENNSYQATTTLTKDSSEDDDEYVIY